MKVRTVAAAVAATFVLSGCGAELTTGVAARIGDTAIETTSFAARVDRTYENEFFAAQQPRQAFQAFLLTRLVRAHLFEVAARRLRVLPTDAEVEAQLQREIAAKPGGREAYYRDLARDAGVHPADVRWEVRYPMLQQRVGDALVADIEVSEDRLRRAYRERLSGYDVARVAHILVRDRALARRVARRAKEPGADFAALARQYSLDARTRDRGGEFPQPLGNGRGEYDEEFEKAVFDAPVGRVVGPVRTVTDDGAKVVGYEIFVVLDRQTTTFEEAAPDLRRIVLNEQIGGRLVDRISSLAGELGVKVNPRFGRWDGEQLAVLPGDRAGLSSPAPIPGLDPPAPPGPAPQPTAPVSPVPTAPRTPSPTATP